MSSTLVSPGTASNRPRTHLPGWREWIALPELGLSRIKAKIDTEARTSALHAFRIEPFTQNAKMRLRFWVHPFQQRIDVVKECVADLIDQRMVSDSGGHRERRYIIETSLELAGSRWPIELTLTARDTMRFRMLLGRTAINGRFLVDPQGSYLTGRPGKSGSTLRNL